MRRRALIALVLVSSSLFAQNRTKQRPSQVAERAKQAIISSFDPALPNITLEQFLAYETHHAPTQWQTSDCREYPLYLADQERGNAICVESFSSLPDGRVLTVTLGLTRSHSDSPRLLSVTIIKDGAEHPLRLIQVPAAIQQDNFPRPSPRDLLPLGRAV